MPVAVEQLLDHPVAALAGPEVLELALQAVNVLLCPGADGALGLSVVGTLAGELCRCEGRDAAGAC